MTVLIITLKLKKKMTFRKYGKSKENRPNPLVQMGLFMDGDAIPLAFNITPGNTNEQETLQPLEQKILDDFNLAKLCCLYRCRSCI